MSQRASESLPPDTATSTRSPGLIMSKSSIAFATWSRHSRRKCSRQKLALWRRTSITAGPRQTLALTRRPPRPPGGRRPPQARGRPCTSQGAPRDDRPDLDLILVAEHRIARDQRVVPDHQHLVAVVAEAVEHADDADRAGDLHLTARVAEQDLHRGPLWPLG